MLQRNVGKPGESSSETIPRKGRINTRSVHLPHQQLNSAPRWQPWQLTRFRRTCGIPIYYWQTPSTKCEIRHGRLNVSTRAGSRHRSHNFDTRGGSTAAIFSQLFVRHVTGDHLNSGSRTCKRLPRKTGANMCFVHRAGHHETTRLARMPMLMPDVAATATVTLRLAAPRLRHTPGPNLATQRAN